MLLSEEQARQKWCPHVRIARREELYPDGSEVAATIVAGCNSDAFGRNRVPASCRCIGSNCMAWRWAGWATTFDTIAPAPRPMDRVGPRLGFCGLAGTPALFPPERE